MAMSIKMILLTVVFGFIFYSNTAADSDFKEIKDHQAKSFFEIIDVNLGDKTWGLNLLKVRAKNTADSRRILKIHIGAGRRRVESGVGFGMGEEYTFEPKQQKDIEHWYWLPPGHGVIDANVTFLDLTDQKNSENPKRFLVRQYELHFSLPNDKCNNLTITEKLPMFEKFYPGLKHMEPLKYFISEHFIFYCSPNTPAFADIEKIKIEREAVLKKISDFTGAAPAKTIFIFLFPDGEIKKVCMGHQGDGMTRGNLIAEVYNDKTKLDPYHELTHVIMGQIGNPPALFNEGFAVYMQKDNIWNGREIDETAADLLKKGSLQSLSLMIARTEIGSQNDDGQVAYPAAGSFVKFLFDNYGKEKFMQAYKKLVQGSDADTVKTNILYVKDIFGKSLDELEMQWHKTLQKK